MSDESDKPRGDVSATQRIGTRPTRRARLWIGVLLGSAASATALALAISAPSFSAQRPAPFDAARAALSARRTVETLTRRYTVLRNALHAHRGRVADAEQMPADMFARLADPTTGSPLAATGPDPSLATYLGTAGGFPVWAVPAASGVVCLEISYESIPNAGSAGTCSVARPSALDGHTVARALIATSTSTYAYLAFGLVPNGTTSVAVTTANGTDVTEPVADNFWSYAATDSPAANLQFKGSSGATQALGFPAEPTTVSPSSP
jgi:hypothetical protein